MARHREGRSEADGRVAPTSKELTGLGTSSSSPVGWTDRP